MRRSITYGVLVITLLAASSTRAEIVELTLTGYWSESNFKVTLKSNASYDPANPQFDGKVFDLSPSDGELTLVLHVNTDTAVFFPNGSQTADYLGRNYSLTHDFYGYREVTLVGGSYSFAGAVWKSEGMLPALDGPKGSKAAIWTDVDLTRGDPSRVSFRMFGKAGSLSADVFFGSRTPSTIGSSFLLWEYYKGEEIRSEKYIARARVLE